MFSRKTGILEEPIFEKKLRTWSAKLSADLRTAFFVSTGKHWGKICSPQSYIRIIPTLDTEQKTLGRFFKPVLELYRATFRTKYCFLEETLFYLQLRLRVKGTAGSANLLFFCRGENLEVKHVSGTEKNLPWFFSVARKTFDRTENRIPVVQGNILK